MGREACVVDTEPEPGVSGYERSADLVVVNMEIFAGEEQVARGINGIGGDEER